MVVNKFKPFAMIESVLFPKMQPWLIQSTHEKVHLITNWKIVCESVRLSGKIGSSPKDPQRSINGPPMVTVLSPFCHGSSPGLSLVHHRFVTDSSPVRHRVPHRFVTNSSPVCHRFVTGSSPVRHWFVTGSSPVRQYRRVSASEILHWRSGASP